MNHAVSSHLKAIGFVCFFFSEKNPQQLNYHTRARERNLELTAAHAQ